MGEVSGDFGCFGAELVRICHESLPIWERSREISAVVGPVPARRGGRRRGGEKKEAASAASFCYLR